ERGDGPLVDPQRDAGEPARAATEGPPQWTNIQHPPPGVHRGEDELGTAPRAGQHLGQRVEVARRVGLERDDERAVGALRERGGEAGAEGRARPRGPVDAAAWKAARPRTARD